MTTNHGDKPIGDTDSGIRIGDCRTCGHRTELQLQTFHLGSPIGHTVRLWECSLCAYFWDGEVK